MLNNDIRADRPSPAKKASFAAKLIRHVVAIISSGLFMAAVPLALYCVAVYSAAETGEDFGGPMIYLIIPLIGGVVGTAISTVIFLPLCLVAELAKFRHWLIGAGTLTFLTAVTIVAFWIYGNLPHPNPSWTGWAVIAATATFYFIGGFFVYLCCVAIGRKIDSYLLRRSSS